MYILQWTIYISRRCILGYLIISHQSVNSGVVFRSIQGKGRENHPLKIHPEQNQWGHFSVPCAIFPAVKNAIFCVTKKPLGLEAVDLSERLLYLHTVGGCSAGFGRCLGSRGGWWGPMGKNMGRNRSERLGGLEKSSSFVVFLSRRWCRV